LINDGSDGFGGISWTVLRSDYHSEKCQHFIL
jgi:hypothetical protein